MTVEEADNLWNGCHITFSSFIPTLLIILFHRNDTEFFHYIFLLQMQLKTSKQIKKSTFCACIGNHCWKHPLYAVKEHHQNFCSTEGL